eukprot:PhM_4_TR17558/c5_g1_i1/m.42625
MNNNNNNNAMTPSAITATTSGPVKDTEAEGADDRTELDAATSRGVWDGSTIPLHSPTGTHCEILKNIDRAHKAPVFGVSLSQDGTMLVSGSGDSAVRLWSTRTYAKIATLRGHKGAVLSCACNPVDDVLATASEDKTVKLWSLATHKKLLTLKGHTKKVYCVRFAPYGDRLASVSMDGTLRVWDCPSGVERFHVKPHKGVAVFTAAFSRSESHGQWAVTGADDGTLALVDTMTGMKVNAQPIRAHTSSVWALEFAQDDSYVLSGGADGVVAMWDVRAPMLHPVGVMRRHTKSNGNGGGGVLSLSATEEGDAGANGNVVMSTSALSSEVVFWDLRVMAATGRFPTCHDSGVYCSAVRGDVHLVGGFDGGITCFEKRS